MGNIKNGNKRTEHNKNKLNQMFERILFASWGDMDFNSHMGNTAYLDKSGDIRMMFFAENGFPMTEFMRLRIGPVIMKDTIEYFKEIHLIEEFRVNIQLAGLSEDGSRFRLKNEFYKGSGDLAATVLSFGGWFSLTERKLIPPPEKLFSIIKTLSHTDDFVIIERPEKRHK